MSHFNSTNSQLKTFSERDWMCPCLVSFRINLQYMMHLANRLLTGSGQQCVLPRTPSATCALEQAGWGKPSWSLEHRDTPTSAGTGTDTPPAGPLGAWNATENKKFEYSVLCGRTVVSSRVYVLHYIFLVVTVFCVYQLTPVFECSPGCVLALSDVLTQHTDFEIYEFAGVSGARAVCERSLCVHNLVL